MYVCMYRRKYGHEFRHATQAEINRRQGSRLCVRNVYAKRVLAGGRRKQKARGVRRMCVIIARVCILLVKISVCSSCELSHRIYVHHTPECFSVSTPKPSLDARNRRRRQEPFASSPAEANILCSTSAIE